MTIIRKPTRQGGLICGVLATFLFLAGAPFCSFAASETNKAPISAVSAAGFHHPGILVNRAQLDFIKAKVAAGTEPWKSAFEAAKASELGSLTYTPHPWKTCECGPFSRPDLGCKDEQRDSAAASDPNTAASRN